MGYILRKTSYGISKRSIRILPIFSSARSKLGSLFEAVGRVTKGKFANQRPMKMSSINSLERFDIPYEVFLRIYGKISPSNQVFSMETLEEIVATNNKNRYSFNADKTKIRANQGHSIPVDVELEEKEPPEFLWHGTGEKYVVSIDEHGLISKNRLYVHLSNDIETAQNVGKRHGKVVIYKVWTGQMYQDGYQFYRSVNGVWLTKYVPVQYLEKMV